MSTELSALKVGDRITVCTPDGWNEWIYEFRTVKHVGKLKIVDSDGYEWKRRNGYEYGRDHGRWCAKADLVPYEAKHREYKREDDAAREKQKRLRELSITDWKALPDGVIEKCYTLVMEAKP